jgi:C_GCAxxG_C_C family probable redox protein
MSSRTEEAVRRFEQGYNCAQSVLVAFASEHGMQASEALRVAAGFGGGMGRLAGTCGAVSGAVMALGLAHGSTEPDAAAKERTYEKVRALVEGFQARHGSILCRDLLGCDIGTPEGFQKAHSQGLTRQLCPRFLRDAGELLEGML